MIITRSNGRRSVVISYDDYLENEATIHLMSSQENIKMIEEAICELESGGGIEVEI